MCSISRAGRSLAVGDEQWSHHMRSQQRIQKAQGTVGLGVLYSWVRGGGTVVRWDRVLNQVHLCRWSVVITRRPVRRSEWMEGWEEGMCHHCQPEERGTVQTLLLLKNLFLNVKRRRDIAVAVCGFMRLKFPNAVFWTFWASHSVKFISRILDC